MKAEDGVSGIVGTVITMGIVVMLTAGFFWKVQELAVDEHEEKMPVVGFASHENRDTISTVVAPDDLSWSEYGWKTTEDTPPGVTIELNGVVFGLIGPSGLTPVGNAPVRAGDLFSFCGPTPLEGVTVLLVHVPSNQVAFMGEFADVRAC